MLSDIPCPIKSMTYFCPWAFYWLTAKKKVQVPKRVKSKQLTETNFNNQSKLYVIVQNACNAFKISTMWAHDVKMTSY